MIIFRPNRATLKESISEAIEFNSEIEMKKYIFQDWDIWSEPLFTIDDIVINYESVHNDPRIGWEDSMYVGIKRMGKEDYMKQYGIAQCIGICATKYKIDSK